MHWLILHSDYLVLKDCFGLCLPVLLQTLESSADSTLRFLGWDVLNLLLDRGIATEIQNFAVCLADFFQTHSPFFFQEDLCRLSVAPFSRSFVLFVLKAFDRGSSCDEQLEHFLRFGCFHCKSEPQCFSLFLEFGLLPLLVQETSLLQVRLQELAVVLLQTCESPQILEVLLSWRCLLLLFGALPQRCLDLAEIFWFAAMAHHCFQGRLE